MTLKETASRWLTPPDQRGWVILGFFTLTWRILDIIQANPRLLANASFMQFIGPIAGAGGLLLIASFLFGSSKGTAEANARTDAVLDATKATGPQPVVVENKADDPVPVEPKP